MGTKLRALYQRKKGRDLFDLYLALSTRELDAEKILECYRKYIEFVAERAPSYKEFVQNMELMDSRSKEHTGGRKELGI